jgi:hypothetical protein
MLESLGITTMLTPPREFDQSSGVVVIRGIIADLFGIFEIQPLDEHMPELLKSEVILFVAMQARQTKLLAQDVIFLKPTPQDRKIIENMQLSNMKTLAARVIRKLSEKMNDFALPRSRAAD